MKRRFATCLIIFSMVIATQLSLLVSGVNACMVREPQTLLTLYKNSDLIVVATYAGAVRGAETSRSDDYAVYDSTESFDVVSTIVGEPINRITFEEEEYVSLRPEEPIVLNVDTDDEDGEDAEDDGDDVEFSAVRNGRSGLTTGDKFLMFVNKNDETGKLEITEYVDGYKRMSDETLAKYVDLIKRLDSIYGEERPNIPAILDWLMAAAADPDTRWEATNELSDSFSQLEYYEMLVGKRDAGEKDASERIKEAFGEGTDLADHAMNFARLLTDQQKEELVRIFLARSVDGKTTNVRGDDELMNVVSRFKRQDVTGSLLDSLRQDGPSVWQVAYTMRSIVSAFDDEELEKIADEYGNELYESDKAFVDDDEDGDAESETENTPGDDDEEESEPTDERPAGPSRSDKDQNGNTAKVETPKKTYGELRAELKSAFIQRADLLISMR